VLARVLAAKTCGEIQGTLSRDFVLILKHLASKIYPRFGADSKTSDPKCEVTDPDVPHKNKISYSDYHTRTHCKLTATVFETEACARTRK
jgi:hypothetical protein